MVTDAEPAHAYRTWIRVVVDKVTFEGRHIDEVAEFEGTIMTRTLYPVADEIGRAVGEFATQKFKEVVRG